MRLLRSLLFSAWLYGLMILMGILLAPAAAWSRDGAYWAIGLYLRLVLAGLRVLCGVTWEVRGTPPQGEALIAAKHQSFLDILILLRALPRARFVMKRSLVWAPVLGFYALRIGASPVTRGKGLESVIEMAREAEKRRVPGGQLVVFPQGTRVKPGAKAPWKPGSHVFYRSWGLPCAPVALNTGLFWPRSGVMKHPGVSVVEFLDLLQAGLNQRDYLAALETRIEPATARLEEEALRRAGR